MNNSKVSRYIYNAFGELENQEGNIENNYLFAGEQFDGSIDQYYLRARYTVIFNIVVAFLVKFKPPVIVFGYQDLDELHQCNPSF